MTQRALEAGFWRGRALEDFSHEEWEALCDGCGRCCLLKLEDDDAAVHYTDIHCRLFDPETCRCGSYALRHQLVKGCVRLTPDTIRAEREWMPATCAYRLLAEGRDLPDWHPLVSGDPDGAAKAGVSVRAMTLIAEYEIDEEDYEDRIVEGIA